MGRIYTYYHDILLPVIWNRPSFIYLRSINQKRLFARKRTTYLKRAVGKYVQDDDTSRTRRIASFNTEIEFDHCIISLRSCLEHLMQLINSVAGLQLVANSNNRTDRVDIDNIIHGLKNNNDAILNRLGNYLDKEKQKDWYKTLHKLRIEIYHNKFERFIKDGKQIKIELPNGQKIELITYCNIAINDLERILTYSMKSLITFLNLAP